MSQSISRRSFLKCAGSGAVSLAAALLTGVCAAAQQPCLAGEPALLDGKAAVELLGYAPAPELGGVLVYLSVENLSAASLPVDTSYLQSRGLRTREQLYSMGTGVTAACNGQSVPCGSFAAPLYSENAADASVFTLNLAAGRGALLHCFCAVPEDWQTLALTWHPDFAAGRSAQIQHPHPGLHPQQRRSRGGRGLLRIEHTCMVVRMPPGLKIRLMHHKSRLAEGRGFQREICPLRKLLRCGAQR